VIKHSLGMLSLCQLSYLSMSRQACQSSQSCFVRRDFRIKRRDFDRPNAFAVRFSLVQFGSLWSHHRMRDQNHVRFTLVQYGVC